MKMASNYFLALTQPATTWFASIQQRSLTSLRQRQQLCPDSPRWKWSVIHTNSQIMPRLCLGEFWFVRTKWVI